MKYPRAGAGPPFRSVGLKVLPTTMRRILGVSLLLLCGAGCRDSADALARDYRNLNNEVIDAMMMITDDASAKVMLDRVLVEYPKRMRSVDDRVKNWKQNNEKEDYGSQIYNSDSVMILILENQMNKDRLALEEARLKKLLGAIVEAKRQEGQANVTPEAACPNLAKLVGSEGKDLDPIKANLEKGTDVISVYKELGQDERFLKSARMKSLKEAFEKKFDEFKQTHLAKIGV